MAAFTWIQMSSLLILMLQFKGTTEQHQTVQTVTAGRGHDVTLPCKNVIQGQHNCNSTTWLYDESSSAVALFELGQNKAAKPKSDRLSLSADCSLVIKKVTDQDVGHYSCRQFKTATGSQGGPDFRIHLSVINSENVTTTKSATSLTTASNNRSADSGKDSDMTTSTTVKSTTRKSTTEPTIKPTLKITNIWTTKEEVKTSEGTLTTNNQPQVQSGFIVIPVCLAALLIIVVVIIRWKKTKVNKAQQSDNMADADDGVSYASISFTKKTKDKARACGDDDDTVTYSTMKALSSPAGLSTDPSDLYSTINKPKK